MLCAAAVCLTAVLVPDRSAAADDPPAYATSIATRYQVTFAARVCPDFSHVMAPRNRDDRIESPLAPGQESEYTDGALVNPTLEARTSQGCDPLTGWRFTIGVGHERAGDLSTVTGMLDEKGPTLAEVPLLDNVGQPTGSAIAGAVTASLTEEQLDYAARRQLWVQAGRPTDPLLGDTTLTFGALRCAADGRSGANVQWLGFTSGIRHVFCFAYYVRDVGPTATIVIRARTTRPVGYPQSFSFATNFGYTPSKSFTLSTRGEAVEATFVRSLSANPHEVTSSLPVRWRLSSLDCSSMKPGGIAAGTSATDVAMGKAYLHLRADEIMTCVYIFEPPPVVPGLTVRIYAEGGSDTFGVTGTGATGSWSLTGMALGDGGATDMTGADLSALAPGTYTLTIARLSNGGAAGWTVTGANCSGVEITERGGVITVPVSAGAAVECVVRVSRSVGGIQLKMATSRKVGTGAFAVAAMDSGGVEVSATATTVGPRAVAVATGEGLDSLGAGSYLITPVTPRTTSEGGWRLTTFDCGEAETQQYTVMEPDQDGVRPPGPLVVTLRPGATGVVCTAAWEFVAATRLQVSLRADELSGTRVSAVVIEVTCEDGSSGRVVLPAYEDTIDEGFAIPLSFLTTTRCVITQPATGTEEGAKSVTTVSLEPDSGNVSLVLPTTVEIRRDVEVYTVSIVEALPAVSRSAAANTFVKTFEILPFILAGAGLVGSGILVLLILAARVRRAAHADDL